MKFYVELWKVGISCRTLDGERQSSLSRRKKKGEHGWARRQKQAECRRPGPHAGRVCVSRALLVPARRCRLSRPLLITNDDVLSSVNRVHAAVEVDGSDPRWPPADVLLRRRPWNWIFVILILFYMASHNHSRILMY